MVYPLKAKICSCSYLQILDAQTVQINVSEGKLALSGTKHNFYLPLSFLRLHNSIISPLFKFFKRAALISSTLMYSPAR